MSRRFCFTQDLKDDPALIAEYRNYHEKLWPEITQSLKHSGVEDLEIYLLGTRQKQSQGKQWIRMGRIVELEL